MNKNDVQKHLIHTTLTKNSTTLYSCENFQLIHAINNVNCSEIVAEELGLINSSKTLVGSIPVTNSGTNFDLCIYFMKKQVNNSDGSNDLITVISIAHANINKVLVLSVLKKIMDKYIEFKQDIENNNDNDKVRSKLGEFKLYMNQIIKFEELNYSTNQKVYNYGSVDDGDEESNGGEVINPRNLVLVNEDVEEVRQLMLDNISKLMNRGDKINLLVDQTDRLTTSASVFQKRAQVIRRRMWLSTSKFYILVALGGLLVLYFLASFTCGFPFFDRCVHR
ncbi:vacuolar v-SNARE Nyv1p [[Candida] jaroonii]|uniref:Vacuolar v-SNARE Nyv1p n=1 Tax=[Candida] jaroonii TaxID=467808 RepID=A0ACA9Y133_9ASCO|nr:vacuolar v-SNARE Nyv1p [[Candida] jaroonii]